MFSAWIFPILPKPIIAKLTLFIFQPERAYLSLLIHSQH